VALRTSHVFVLERRAVQRLTAGYPLLERALLARFARDARVHARRTDELAAGPVEERVHRLLERLSNQYGTPLGNGRFIALPLRRKDLASMVNATTETVSRLLAKLEREGQVRSTRDGIWWRSAARPIPQAASQAASQHAGPSASQAASQAANQAVPPPIPAVPSSRRGV
jgi:hypothetical protein